MHVAAVVGLAAPSFESFLSHSDGHWKGASYTWQAAETEGAKPLGVAPGYVTTPQCSTTRVSAVMRSCGGAVQGVEEERCVLQSSKIVLNRQADGTTFFTYGSWAQAPPVLSLPGAKDGDMLASTEAFGVSICLAHADRSRRRLLAVVVGGQLATCDVTVEGFESAEGSVSCSSLAISAYNAPLTTVVRECFAADFCGRHAARGTDAVCSRGEGLGGRRFGPHSRWHAARWRVDMDQRSHAVDDVRGGR